MTAPARRARVEVDLAAIRHNVGRLARVAPDAEVCAVVKADGYGHGAVPVARAALAGGATCLAVARVGEAASLREAGIDAPIVMLAEAPPAAADRIVALGVTPSLYTAAMADALDALGQARSEAVAVHCKVDTGMGRVGVPLGDWPRFIADVAGREGLAVEGIFTHLARADEPDAGTTERQLSRFDGALEVAADAGVTPRVVHAANSAAALNFPASHHDLVRAGIAVYGLSPAPSMPAAAAGLTPALRLVTEVAFAKRVAAGTHLSYGHTFRTPAEGWVATLPLGYADGVPRALAGRAEVLVAGRPHPIAGAVCMDQILVWCGGHEVARGDEVVLLGGQGGARIPVEDWAEIAGTITYEITTGLSPRLPRRYHDEEA